jgi:hypothetical protein
MLVWKMGNFWTEALPVEPKMMCRTFERGLSDPSRSEPFAKVPSANSAITPFPPSLKAMSTISLPYCGKRALAESIDW